MNNFGQSGEDLAKRLQDAISTSNEVSNSNLSTESKQVKIARLIVILGNIQKELKTVEGTLHKLWDYQTKHNPNSPIISQITEKINTVERLRNKITKAKLNLNYYFI